MSDIDDADGAPPLLITFDIFGTVLDWRSGLEASCAAAGRPLQPGDFDRIVDVQGELEAGEFLDYTAITRRSLIEAIAMDASRAANIADGIGRWPIYADAAAIRSLMEIAPCAAMTNSDRRHGDEVQARLGFKLDAWLCSEEIRTYKPDPRFWLEMGRSRGIGPGAGWWHVSAYADYDLSVARKIGLTTVFVQRPHARPGPASHTVADLHQLLRLLG